MIQNSAGRGWGCGRDRCSYTLPRTFENLLFQITRNRNTAIAIYKSHSTNSTKVGIHKIVYQSSSSHRKHKQAFQTLPKPTLHAPCWAIDKKTVTTVRFGRRACLFIQSYKGERRGLNGGHNLHCLVNRYWKCYTIMTVGIQFHTRL